MGYGQRVFRKLAVQGRCAVRAEQRDQPCLDTAGNRRAREYQDAVFISRGHGRFQQDGGVRHRGNRRGAAAT